MNYWEEYFKNVSPTYMENWYQDLKDFTIPSVSFPISTNQANAIMNILDGSADGKQLDALKLSLDYCFRQIGGDRFFVRLGSRSPKDNPVEIKEPKDVLTAFGDSERILEDLNLALNNNYHPFIFVRKWVDIKRKYEFRCFVKNNKLVGISQYFYREKYYYLDNPVDRSYIQFQAKNLLDEINSKISLKDFVFDICYLPLKSYPLLIEINPFSSWTDPCLFDWVKDDFKKFKFKWLEKI
jgi:hypothetical protein